MVLVADCVSAEFFLSITDFFLSFAPGHVHQSSMFRVVDVLLVIQLLIMNGFFPPCYGFFPLCHGLHRAVVCMGVANIERWKRAHPQTPISGLDHFETELPN